jgi:hypothetical protein
VTVPFSRKGRVEFLSLSSRKATVAFPPHLMDKKRRNPYQESNYLIHLSLFNMALLAFKSKRHRTSFNQLRAQIYHEESVKGQVRIEKRAIAIANHRDRRLFHLIDFTHGFRFR